MKEYTRPKKAYLNTDFIMSRDGRLLRIMSEHLEPESRFEHYDVRDTIVFFGSARTLPRDQAAAELEEARRDGGDVAGAEARLAASRYYEDARALAGRLTTWSKGLEDPGKRFVVCTGGGPGIMEAANRGASEARGLNIGLNISLPMEQYGNPYTTRELTFEFHYFFMRKFWFAYLAKALIVFPGGFGTLDEFFEVMTLIQTRKIRKRLPVVLFGKPFWDEVVNFDALIRHGTISSEDLDLFFATDSVDEAFDHLTRELTTALLAEPVRRTELE
ncbi:MAG: TIGR00730 family Rossman fold protein [Hyphomicrobiales bacterium]|nr:TIGR00730 family Rossman fold protein [Hyphomicrobiales bacterium]MCP5372314.1 TIGR00730 family Rossman fold protein [Hyphomicrobiales bacterium]